MDKRITKIYKIEKHLFLKIKGCNLSLAFL